MKYPVSIAGFLLIVVATVIVHRSASAATSQPAVPSAMEQVNDALKLSPKDTLLLSSLRDSLDPVEQNGFYRMMQIVSALPALNAEELRRLDGPAWTNLLREPSRYRRLPVRLNLHVYVVRELKVGKGLQASPYWPEGASLYEIHATYHDSRDEPVLLYAAAAPENLGKPTETLGDGRVRYSAGPAYQAVGVFLQYYTDTSTDGDTRNYPVILAWQFTPASSSGGSIFDSLAGNGQMVLWGAVLLLLIAAAGIFVFVQRRLKRPIAAQRGVVFKNYKSLRDKEPDDTENENYVDPELAAAVEPLSKDKNPTVDTAIKENEDAE